MIRIGLSGCNGRMGRAIADICSTHEEMQIVCGFDIGGQAGASFPVYTHLFDCKEDCDVIIDFSNVSITEELLRFGVERNIPLVICTTGHSEKQIEKMQETAQKIPVFRSGNMSLGINLLMEIIGRAARVLGDSFDVEIVEKHHNQKLDAPSGTALMLAEAVRENLPHESELIYTRHDRRAKRDPKEIGISAVRGGTIVGEHTVLFCGRDEVIELTHIAHSREIFAVGALNAAKFLYTVNEPGFYTMRDVIDKI